MDDITVERRRAACLGEKLMECVRFASRTLRVFAILGVLAQPSWAQSDAQMTGTDSTPRRERHYWRDFTAGFAASLLAHESAHVVTSYAVGSHPTFGFDKGRPTVYSNIDAERDPEKQFLFSSMGLNVQAALDEAILDVPHSRGSAFERGVLASGIATALFYITIGRTASVSDVDFMARTSSLSKTDIALIYGGVAALHTFRISRDGRYANFFVRPNRPSEGGMRVGVGLSP
ncbi:MAG: hypothetical protein JWL61_3251 [Gemmatimonadetes bacterium]|nr:hypothetical protein [Gemmatimonadota bacterium]